MYEAKTGAQKPNTHPPIPVYLLSRGPHETLDGWRLQPERLQHELHRSYRSGAYTTIYAVLSYHLLTMFHARARG